MQTFIWVYLQLVKVEEKVTLESRVLLKAVAWEPCSKISVSIIEMTSA